MIKQSDSLEYLKSCSDYEFDINYSDPFVMIYNKPSASKEMWKLQRWCNNKRLFNSVNNFYDFYKK